MSKDVFLNSSPEQSALPAWSLDLVPSVERDYAGRRWQDLQREFGTESATNSWGWINTWVEHFGHEVQHTYVFGNERGTTKGAALLTNPFYSIRRGPLRMNTLFVGTSGEKKEESPHLSDHRLLVSSEGRPQFARALMDYIASRSWDQLLLQGMVPEDALSLADAAHQSGVRLSLQNVPYPVFDLAIARNIYSDVVDALPQNKKRVRRGRKELQKRFGTIQGEWAQSQESARDIFNELVRLNEERWSRIGHESAFPTDRIKQYYADLISSLFDEGKISLYRYQAGDITLGCIYSIHDNNGVVVGYKSGINLNEATRKYAPGILTHVAYMGELWKRGYNQYDYGWGGDEYKNGIANKEDHLYFGFAYRGLKAQSFGVARNVYNRHRDDPLVENARERIGDTKRRVKRIARL